MILEQIPHAHSVRELKFFKHGGTAHTFFAIPPPSIKILDYLPLLVASELERAIADTDEPEIRARLNWLIRMQRLAATDDAGDDIEVQPELLCPHIETIVKWNDAMTAGDVRVGADSCVRCKQDARRATDPVSQGAAYAVEVLGMPKAAPEQDRDLSLADPGFAQIPKVTIDQAMRREPPLDANSLAEDADQPIKIKDVDFDVFLVGSNPAAGRTEPPISSGFGIPDQIDRTIIMTARFDRRRR